LLGGRSGTSAVASTVGRGRVLPGQDHPRGRRGVRHMDIFPGVDRGAAQLLARALGTATAARTGPTAGDPGLLADPVWAAAGLIPAAAWRGQAAGVAHMDRCVYDIATSATAAETVTALSLTTPIELLPNLVTGAITGATKNASVETTDHTVRRAAYPYTSLRPHTSVAQCRTNSTPAINPFARCTQYLHCRPWVNRRLCGACPRTRSSCVSHYASTLCCSNMLARMLQLMLLISMMSVTRCHVHIHNVHEEQLTSIVQLGTAPSEPPSVLQRSLRTRH
jgi:hypothetical protein